MATTSLTVVGGAATQAVAATPCSAAATSDRAQGTWLNGSLAAGRANYYRFTTTSNQYAMVTLGDLHANLALAIYDSSCHLVATSDRGGLTFEQVYRYLGAGHYYVRVTGDAGAASTYDVKFSSLANGSVLLGYHSSIQTFGEFVIAGAVLNNEPYPVVYDLVAVYLYDSAGHLVDHVENGNFPIEYASARSRVPFIVNVDNPPSYARVTMKFKTVAPYTGTEPTPPTSILPSSPWTLDGTTHYPGSITNVAPRTEVLNSVVVTAYDANGSPRYVAYGQILPSTLVPGATGGFDATLSNPTEVNARAYQAFLSGEY